VPNEEKPLGGVSLNVAKFLPKPELVSKSGKTIVCSSATTVFVFCSTASC